MLRDVIDMLIGLVVVAVTEFGVYVFGIITGFWLVGNYLMSGRFLP